jgi:hypothetical protein
MRSSAFFEGVAQGDVKHGDEVLKVPIFYYDGEVTVGIFPAKLAGLRKLLPDRRFNPARIAPGVGAIAMTCYEYRDTDIRPYNELAIAIPLSEPYFRANPPGRAMLDQVRSGQFHAWVQHLPVTTELARAGGVDFYNYPKFLASIDYTEHAHSRSCRLAEGEEEILTMSCEKIAGGDTQDVQIFTHIWMDRQPQAAEFKIRGHRMGRSVKPGAARLTLGGRHPIARELGDVLLSTKSIAAAYAPKIEGILYGPEQLSVALIDRVIRGRYEQQVEAAR